MNFGAQVRTVRANTRTNRTEFARPSDAEITILPPQKRYSARLARATPPWADVAKIYAIYDRAHDLRAAGIPATVDHVYPLAGKEVCGLHVSKNLRIITSSANSKKSNRTEEPCFSRGVVQLEYS